MNKHKLQAIDEAMLVERGVAGCWAQGLEEDTGLSGGELRARARLLLKLTTKIANRGVAQPRSPPPPLLLARQPSGRLGAATKPALLLQPVHKAAQLLKIKMSRVTMTKRNFATTMTPSPPS